MSSPYPPHLRMVVAGMISSLIPRTARVARWPVYRQMLSLYKARSDDFIFLNIGCGFGDVTFQAVEDGLDPRRTLSVDTVAKFWEIGKIEILGESDPRAPLLPFLHGDLLDKTFLPPLPSASLAAKPARQPLDLRSLTTLKPLHGQVSAIFAERLFHLFTDGQQSDLMRRLAPLLSTKKGSMIFGRQIGGQQPGEDSETESHMQSPESWTRMWAEAFPEGHVKIDAKLEKPDEMTPSNLWWSVVRE
ncbi:hypothetical protein C8R44DRAFT_263268 [Mycena epipterygia]|nr:hypothetical protein C8R44DRAFT_263268 [Mycena epipterygia]